MPFIGYDPWEETYFKNIRVPKNVVIPVGDVEAYELYPDFNWVYDKTEICDSQNIVCAPTPVCPAIYPVFVKPITNLWGMGAGAHPVHSLSEMKETFQPGCFWMPYYEGHQYSTDCVIIKGELQWVCHTEAFPFTNIPGTFDYWEIEPHDILEVCILIIDWVRTHIPKYTGMLNIETIGDKIIEVHLRMSPQFIDLYPDDFLLAVVKLYDKGVWEFNSPRQTGYSLVLFATEYISKFKLLEKPKEILSVQDCTKEEFVMASHPLGGIRLAVINSRNFKEASKYRKNVILINKLLSLIE